MKSAKKTPIDVVNIRKPKPTTSSISRRTFETMLRRGVDAGNALATDEPLLVIPKGVLDYSREE